MQYVGGERNATVTPWEDAQVHWALCYPDAYEVGLPNQGLMILYEVLNERPDALAERTYAVWPDLAALMREHGVPQFTVDAHRPVAAFDVLGVSFATELGYTNLLEILDLAGIPLHAADRTTEHPLVLAGGHAAFNPEPIADFVDIVALGDGEEVVGEITDVVKAAKAEGIGRRETLERLAGVPGVYVPSLYEVTYAEGGAITGVRPTMRRRPGARAQAHHVRPRRLALPEAAARADGRDGARADERRDLPGLHARLPLLPGRDDHPAGPRAVEAGRQRDGRAGAGGLGLLRGRPALAELGRPLRDRGDRQGPGRPLRGHRHRALAAVDPRGRVQRRPRRGAAPAPGAGRA